MWTGDWCESKEVAQQTLAGTILDIILSEEQQVAIEHVRPIPRGAEPRGHPTDVDASQLHGSLNDWEAPDFADFEGGGRAYG